MITKLILIVLAGWLLSGCASVTSTLGHGHPNRKEIYVQPGSVANTKAGQYVDSDWDGLVKIPRGAGAFRSNHGVVIKEGYTVGTINGHVNWWILGNVVYGGPIGLGVDFISGGAYDPKVTLGPYSKAVIIVRQ